MITPKYNYGALDRNTIDGVRHYVLPDKTHVPSVTTILDATKDPSSTIALDNWRKRVGPAKAAEISAEAAGTGTRMHAYLERYVHAGILAPPGTNPYSIQSNKMAAVIVDKAFPNIKECYGTEAPLYFSGLYAGTTDLVGSWNGQLAILDYKQTNKPKKEEWIDDYKVQTTAYAAAHDHMFGTKIRCGVILMCSRSGEYQHWVLEGSEFIKWQDKWWDRVQAYHTRPNRDK